MKNLSKKLMIFFLFIASMQLQAVRTDFMDRGEQSSEESPIFKRRKLSELKVKSILKDNDALKVAAENRLAHLIDESCTSNKKIRFKTSENEESILKFKRKKERVKRYEQYEQYAAWNLRTCRFDENDKIVPEVFEMYDQLISELWQTEEELMNARIELAVERGFGDIKLGLKFENQKSQAVKYRNGLVLKGLKYDTLIKKNKKQDFENLKLTEKLREQGETLQTAVTVACVSTIGFIALVICVICECYKVKQKSQEL